MALYPDPPKGWAELQARMVRAKTSEEINEILKEMNQVLGDYQAKAASDRRSQTSPDLPRD